MNVNGITNVTEAYSSYPSTKTETKESIKEKTTSVVAESTVTSDDAAVYEASGEKEKSPAKTYTPNTELVAKLKADLQSRTNQLKSIVEQMLSKQTNAYGQANDMWKFLASGNYTVDAETKAQAQADIAEDGYWGVSQTSSRILDFATALTGGDPEKIEEMRDAFEKGYKSAEKTWGGELPDICKQTYDAVLAGFDALAAQE